MMYLLLYKFDHQFSHFNLISSSQHCTMTSLQDYWPEPITRVQSLAESGLSAIPPNYVKLPSQRPQLDSNPDEDAQLNIPVVDLSGLNGDEEARKAIYDKIAVACREWGFFQVVNHGIRPELLSDIQEIWREFFYLPMEEKQVYANSPKTYEGYGSRLGVQKGAILDWNDYFFLNYMPASMKDPNKWPALPVSLRDLTEEYGSEAWKLCQKLMKILSTNLGLEEDGLENLFGGKDGMGAPMRVNFYPKCPQPELTLGLSPHSDPGVITLLLPDDSVAGLQVRKGDKWVTVQSVPNAIVVNLADQIQVVTNATYKSIEHRAITNSTKERISIATFYSPRSDILMQPAKEFVTPERPALYPAMTFDEYRLFIRTKGPQGKSQVASLESS